MFLHTLKKRMMMISVQSKNAQDLVVVITLGPA